MKSQYELLSILQRRLGYWERAFKKTHPEDIEEALINVFQSDFSKIFNICQIATGLNGDALAKQLGLYPMAVNRYLKGAVPHKSNSLRIITGLHNLVSENRRNAFLRYTTVFVSVDPEKLDQQVG